MLQHEEETSKNWNLIIDRIDMNKIIYRKDTLLDIKGNYLLNAIRTTTVNEL